MSELTAKDYKNALDVQNACNLSGVVLAFAEVMKKISKDANSTDEKNNHPIAVMYASKIESLTNCYATEVFTKAFDECSEKSKEETCNLRGPCPEKEILDM